MQKSKTQHRKPRKNVRRKLHKGRLAFVLLILLAIIALTLWAFGCFDYEKSPKPVMVQEDTVETIQCDTIISVSEFAMRDAQKILDSKPETFERHQAILLVKSRETELRLNGHNHAADVYIKTIEKLCK